MCHWEEPHRACWVPLCGNMGYTYVHVCTYYTISIGPLSNTINKYLREYVINTGQTLLFLELPPPAYLISINGFFFFRTSFNLRAWCHDRGSPVLMAEFTCILYHHSSSSSTLWFHFFCRSSVSHRSVHTIAFLPSKSSLASCFQFISATEQKHKQYPFINWLICLSPYSKN